jgi:hypothetical protein
MPFLICKYFLMKITPLSSPCNKNGHGKPKFHAQTVEKSKIGHGKWLFRAQTSRKKVNGHEKP